MTFGAVSDSLDKFTFITSYYYMHLNSFGNFSNFLHHQMVMYSVAEYTFFSKCLLIIKELPLLQLLV